MSDRFLIPEKLYGRQHEVETLLAAFARVKGSRTTEMILVAGVPGVGKTAVVNEVHKVIAQQHRYFIEGTFDRLKRDIPLSGLIQALEDLIEQLLTETDAEIQQWKAKILSALGEQAQIIIDVLPKLELIIGKQPIVNELSGIAAQHRFNFFLKKFIQIFTTKEHPLVIFLDNLHWADAASLNFIQFFMSGSDINLKNLTLSYSLLEDKKRDDDTEGGLLILGAYRNNEFSRTHPLSLTLNEIRKTKARIHSINIETLNQANSNSLIADILCCAEKVAIPLNQMVFAKTKGNPFLIHRFLKFLYYEEAIQFHVDTGHWQCDLTKVKALALTDDVVEFMILQMEKLPTHTKKLLKLAACIGNSFDLNTLSIVYQKSVVDTAGDLWTALVEGLILLEVDVVNDKLLLTQNPSSGIISNQEPKQLPNANSKLPQYKFVHDRVRQAAYSLIPEAKKQSILGKATKFMIEIPMVSQKNLTPTSPKLVEKLR
ncbi:AAA family ATPase [Brasilonema sp. UFV-L1]|nr:AAA family ATPase [Brasilonema sp. UFV-L1]